MVFAHSVGMIYFSWLRSSASAESHGSSPSEHKQAPSLMFRPCPAPARQRGGKGSPRPWVHPSSVCCKHLCLLQPAHGQAGHNRNPATILFTQSACLRYKYFYSFSLFLWSSFWVQWEIYSVMFGSSCIFWGWCHETQDAQILPCLNNLSRFYCRAPHHGMQVLPKHSDLQRQGQGRALCFLGMEGRSLLLCTLGRVFPELEGGFVAWVLR